MHLEFYRRRRANLKGEYLYLVGGGVTVVLEFEKPAEVADELAFKILDRDPDMIRQVEAKKTRKKKDKMVKEYKNTADTE